MSRTELQNWNLWCAHFCNEQMGHRVTLRSLPKKASSTTWTGSWNLVLFCYNDTDFRNLKFNYDFLPHLSAVDVIGGSLGGNTPHDIEIETHSHPHPDHGPSNNSEEDTVVIQEQPLKPFYTPFFNDPFFNAFGFGFPGFGRPESQPWWKG